MSAFGWSVVGIAALYAVMTPVVFALCKVSSDISKEEERDEAFWV